MAVTGASPYPTLFRTFIEQALKRSLVQVQACSGPLPVDVRDQALHTLSFGLKLPPTWPLTRTLLLELAPRMEQMGHREDWLPYLQAGIAASERIDDRLTAGECYLQLGILQRMLSALASAKTAVDTAIGHFVAVQEKLGQARSFNELAWIQYLQQRYAEAETSVQQAIPLAASDDPVRAMSYRVLGMIAFDQQRWPAAEAYHRQALAIFEQIGDIRRSGWSYSNLATALRYQRRYPDAIAYYHKATDALLQSHDQYHWAHVQMNLGSTYCDDGQPIAGTRCHQSAHHVFTALNDKLNLAKAGTGLGLGNLMQGRIAEAEVAFQQSIRLFLETGFENWRLNAVDGLAMTYLAAQEYAKAATLLEQALMDLAKITDAPNYNYLVESLNQHLVEAKAGQRSV